MSLSIPILRFISSERRRICLPRRAKRNEPLFTAHELFKNFTVYIHQLD
ncbi:hypothetical protein KEJ48_07435 [Candidatus Bathyarchaeota archaeon]|nr:hypothetical protein [Candidatus Bathyarchaeota archaeon]